MNKEDILYHKLTDTPVILNNWEELIEHNLFEVSRIHVYVYNNPGFRFVIKSLANGSVLNDKIIDVKTNLVQCKEYQLFSWNFKNETTTLRLLAKCPKDNIVYHI